MCMPSTDRVCLRASARRSSWRDPGPAAGASLGTEGPREGRGGVPCRRLPISQPPAFPFHFPHFFIPPLFFDPLPPINDSTPHSCAHSCAFPIPSHEATLFQLCTPRFHGECKGKSIILCTPPTATRRALNYAPANFGGGSYGVTKAR